MGILTADMKRVVGEQRLGFVATVCADGTPNLSPKGTTAVWDDDHLVFANIRSPGTLANLRQKSDPEALGTLERALQLSKEGDPFARLFLAMAHWQKGDKDEAGWPRIFPAL